MVVLVLSTTCNDLFCRCVDGVSTWRQIFNFVFFSLKCSFQFNSRILRTHFASVMNWNNWDMIPETRNYIFRSRSRCRRRRVCCWIVNLLYFETLRICWYVLHAWWSLLSWSCIFWWFYDMWSSVSVSRPAIFRWDRSPIARKKRVWYLAIKRV